MRILRNEKGQGVVEGVLIITLLLGIAAVVMTFIKDEEVFAKIVKAPWAHIDGMIQAGVWQPAAKAYENHPGRFNNTTARQKSLVDQPL